MPYKMNETRKNIYNFIEIELKRNIKKYKLIQVPNSIKKIHPDHPEKEKMLTTNINTFRQTKLNKK